MANDKEYRVPNYERRIGYYRSRASFVGQGVGTGHKALMLLTQIGVLLITLGIIGVIFRYFVFESNNSTWAASISDSPLMGNLIIYIFNNILPFAIFAGIFLVAIRIMFSRGG